MTEFLVHLNNHFTSYTSINAKVVCQFRTEDVDFSPIPGLNLNQTEVIEQCAVFYILIWEQLLALKKTI